MNSKAKGLLSILFMAITFYMMVTTKYTLALGDYLLEFIGLRSWTGDYSGTHLTIIYFGIPFIVCIFLVKKYAVDILNYSRKKVFFIFILLVTVFYLITGFTVRNIKKNSPGLLSVGYDPGDSSINYVYEDGKFVEFKARFELTNYSHEKKTFYVSINRPFHQDDGIEEIKVYTLDGEPARFELDNKETKSFVINLENFNVIGTVDFESGSGSGNINEVVLTNDKGDKVKLYSKNFFGIKLNR